MEGKQCEETEKRANKSEKGLAKSLSQLPWTGTHTVDTLILVFQK
jgi:hypothetical protein